MAQFYIGNRKPILCLWDANFLNNILLLLLLFCSFLLIKDIVLINRFCLSQLSQIFVHCFQFNLMSKDCVKMCISKR